jgi:maltose O-acetyltransferase
MIMKKILGIVFFIFSIVIDRCARLIKFESVRAIWLYNKWKVCLKYLGDGTCIYPSVVIHGAQMVSVGKNCNIAEYVHMWGGGGIEISDNALIASHVVITSITHDINAHIYAQSSIKKKVKINSNVWIGAGVIILPGVEIGEGAVIGAGSVVTKNVEAYTVNVGIPSRKVKTNANER